MGSLGVKFAFCTGVSGGTLTGAWGSGFGAVIVTSGKVVTGTTGALVSVATLEGAAGAGVAGSVTAVTGATGAGVVATVGTTATGAGVGVGVGVTSQALAASLNRAEPASISACVANCVLGVLWASIAYEGASAVPAAPVMLTGTAGPVS